MAFIDINELVVGQWDRIYSALLPQLNLNTRKHQSHPIHGGKDGCRLDGDWLNNGKVWYNSRFAHADGLTHVSYGIQNLMYVHGWDFKTTAAKIREVLGGCGVHLPQPTAQPVQPKESEAEENGRLKKYAYSLFCSASFGHQEVIKYLAGRGIDHSIVPDDIRYSTRIAPAPAMVAAVRNVNGDIIAINRTFISNGEKVYPYPGSKVCKMALAKIGGGSVWLGPDVSDTLVLVEGTETGLALLQMRAGYSIWCSLTAANFALVEIPACVKRLILAGDNDLAGENAVAKKACLVKTKASNEEWEKILEHYAESDLFTTRTLSAREKARELIEFVFAQRKENGVESEEVDIEVVISFPPVGNDWNDYLNHLQTKKRQVA